MHSQLINLMLELQEKQGISYIYVPQHLRMMKHMSDQVMVMHHGYSWARLFHCLFLFAIN